MNPEFRPIPFANPQQAAEAIDRILALGPPTLIEHFAKALAECPDPNVALVRLEHFLSASLSPRTELDVMAATFRYARLVLTVLGQSQFLTDIVLRNPEFMFWLWEEATLENARSRDDLLAELRALMQNFNTFESQCEALRRFKRREILRIATRDIFAHVELPTLTEDLSNLADAAVQIAIECAEIDLLKRYGSPLTDTRDSATFVVLGMGKLGGCELNFSSDIDLVFLYSARGATEGGDSGSVNNAEYFHKLGERIIKAVSEQTAEGNVFRVDMRLRPHGRRGPLAVDIHSALHYYEAEGEAWERQALMKARPIAGDLDLGERFLELARPFIFPRYFDDETLEDIRAIKLQMEAQVAGQGKTHLEVKLGHGGIRDIEFTVQMLQLLNGGRIPELRTRSTLDAIAELGMKGILSPFDATTLTSNYTYLRQVEHRLQIEGSQQIHALPADPDELDAFARRMGYESGQSFMVEYADRAAETRTILDKFLASEGAGTLWVADLLNPRSGGEAGKEGLASLGFKDVERARKELIRLTVGPKEHPNTLHVRQQFVKVAPGLLDAMARAADPDRALSRLAHIFSNLRAPASIYGILEYSPALAPSLITLVENSAYITERLIRDPGLFETFGRPGALDRPSSREELEADLAALCRAYDRDAAPYRLHDGETLRVGMRDLLLDVDVAQIGRELSLLADVCVQYVYEKAIENVRERYGIASGAFAVLGLGKLGGNELGYGSDLDLVFVYESKAEIDSGMSPIEYFTALASQLLRGLKEPTRYGILYDVDARLRPDGKKGSLVVSSDRLAEYYANEAQAWERLALMKVRAIGGDALFARRLESSVQNLAFDLELNDANLANIEDVRKKIVASASALDLKKGEGGIVEIEFIARLLQLKHAPSTPGLKRSDLLGVLPLLTTIGALSPEQTESLRNAYIVFRRLENRLRIMEGRSTSTLPNDPDTQTDLARRLSIETALNDTIKQHRHQVHTIYESILANLTQ